VRHHFFIGLRELGGHDRAVPSDAFTTVHVTTDPVEGEMLLGALRAEAIEGRLLRPSGALIGAATPFAPIKLQVLRASEARARELLEELGHPGRLADATEPSEDAAITDARAARRGRLRWGLAISAALVVAGLGVGVAALVLGSPLRELDVGCTDHDVRLKNRGGRPLNVAVTFAAVTPLKERDAGIVSAFLEGKSASRLAPGAELVVGVRVPTEALTACADRARHPHGCVLGFHVDVGGDGETPVRGLGMCTPRWSYADAAPVPATRLRLVR
jgi:hypothetical protein